MKTNKFLALLLAFTMVVSAFCMPLKSNSYKVMADEIATEELLKLAEEKEAGIKEFVTRMYRVCLDRTPDEEGLEGWADKLINKEATGCSVAYGFVFSPEFQSKQATNAQYISYMYDAFFGRKPDTDGFEYWVDLLDNGMEREDVFCGFANSLEFANLCEEYDVVRGFHIAKTDYNQTAMVNLFVERLYNVVLDRTCDQEGMAGWTTNLVEHTQSGGEVAYGFVFSPEFLNKHLCNKHYTEILYEAFLGRSSDASGEAYWVEKLEKGETRETVFNGFAGSVEFAAICDAYGIDAGKVDVSGATYGGGDCTMCEEEINPTSAPTNQGNSDTNNVTSTPGVSVGTGDDSSKGGSITGGGSTAGNSSSTGNGSTTGGSITGGGSTAGNGSSTGNGSTTGGSITGGGSTAGNGSSTGNGSTTGGSITGGGSTAGNGSSTGNGSTTGGGDTPSTTPGTTVTPSTSPSTTPTDTPIPSSEPTTTYVTYEQFGAKGDGVTDDYAAIVATHEYANEHNLPVKATAGAKYYVCHMDPNNKEGAIIKTNTYWDGAEFIIDDYSLTNYDERECFLFTVATSISPTWKYIAPLNDSDNREIGLDALLYDCPEYPDNVSMQIANQMKNKSFAAGTTQLEGTFPMKALYFLKSSSIERWTRNGNKKDAPRPQEEVILVNTDGSIDSSTPITWDWDKINSIKIFPYDENTLYISGGTFTTKLNMLPQGAYFYRGIKVNRSNVVIDGVKHYLTGEENYTLKDFTDTKGNTTTKIVNNGAHYYGFLYLNYCADVTVQNSIFSAHKIIYNDNGGQTDGTYDITADHACGITFRNVTESTDIYNETRWGITGTNYCKNLIFDNCSLNLIDGHKGIYNLTVENSQIGIGGIIVIGFGDLIVNNTTCAGRDCFIGFRDDFGCAWYGDVYVNNCTWILKSATGRISILKTLNFDPGINYCYGKDEEGYYNHLVNSVNIDGFTIDASNMSDSSIRALYNTQTMHVFSWCNNSKKLDDEFLNDPTKNVYPVKAPKVVNLKNVTVIKNGFAPTKNLAISLMSSDRDAAFYKDTVFNYDASTQVEKVIK